MQTIRTIGTGMVLFYLAAGFNPASVPPQAGSAPRAEALLPKIDGWTASQPLQKYVPDTLFEYIDGAAENFISYNFVELAVGQYGGPGGKAEMTVEIYDMGAPDNAFGIYGSERYPESRFLPVGVQGYLEDEILNFFAGRFYVKLMAYEAGDKTAEALQAFAAAVVKGIPDPGAFPLPVRAFAPAGRVDNSEKFILRDFLGLTFLSRGFVASYRIPNAGEFDAFVIEGPLPEEAAKSLMALVGHFAKPAPPDVAPGEIVRLKDPYLANILAVREGRFIIGAVKVKDGMEEAAEKIVRETARALAGK
jgi:hypothetical protein